eukprot:TRINITY_DN31096_c0_g1_i1.p1 TRINITY_DN31096_c0_g1~~TRINITY_DN31096_c0_g1_i1.p1  ORF type:complete len:197 (+),score=32.99 TRINITY_DN31096_c0_g1_i1:51-641(+)
MGAYGSSCSGGDGLCGTQPLPMPAVGSAVQANYDGDWYDGTVEAVHPVQHTVDFVAADGSFVTEGLPVQLLRRPCLFRVGDLVSVQWGDDEWFDGTVTAVDKDTGSCDVLWDALAEDDGTRTRTPGVSMWLMKARDTGAQSPSTVLSSPPWTCAESSRQEQSPSASSRLHAGAAGGHPDIWLRGPTPASPRVHAAA